MKPLVWPERQRLTQLRAGRRNVVAQHALVRHGKGQQVRDDKVVAAHTGFRLPLANACRELRQLPSVCPAPCQQRACQQQLPPHTHALAAKHLLRLGTRRQCISVPRVQKGDPSGRQQHHTGRLRVIDAIGEAFREIQQLRRTPRSRCTGGRGHHRLPRQRQRESPRFAGFEGEQQRLRLQRRDTYHIHVR